MVSFYLAHRGKIRSQVRTLQKSLESTYKNLKLVHPYYDLDQSIEGEELVRQDLGAVKRSNGVIAIGADLFIPSAEPFNQGGVIEYYYAHTLGKEVYIITKKMRDHPFVKTFATKMFSSLEEFLEWFDKYMGVNNEKTIS